jgi:excisionase family DNA binding protein
MSTDSQHRGRSPVDLMRAERGGHVCGEDGDRTPEEVGRCSTDRRPGRGSDKAVPARRGPLTLGEAAVYLNVNERYMRRLVSERRIPYFKVGRLLRFSPVDLDAFIEACRVEVPLVHPLLRAGRRSPAP